LLTACPYELADRSFEEGAGWSLYGIQGYDVTTGSQAQDGEKYISVTDGAAQQTLVFDRRVKYPFT